MTTTIIFQLSITLFKVTGKSIEMKPANLCVIHGFIIDSLLNPAMFHPESISYKIENLFILGKLVDLPSLWIIETFGATVYARGSYLQWQPACPGFKPNLGSHGSKPSALPLSQPSFP